MTTREQIEHLQRAEQQRIERLYADAFFSTSTFPSSAHMGNQATASGAGYPPPPDGPRVNCRVIGVHKP